MKGLCASWCRKEFGSLEGCRVVEGAFEEAHKGSAGFPEGLIGFHQCSGLRAPDFRLELDPGLYTLELPRPLTAGRYWVGL